jgi:hypothetical protein
VVRPRCSAESEAGECDNGARLGFAVHQRSSRSGKTALKLTANFPVRAAEPFGPRFAKYKTGHHDPQPERLAMNNIVYIVGLIVIVVAVLSFFGLR